MVVFEWESSSYSVRCPHFAGVSRRARFLLSPLFSVFHIGIRRFPAARNTCSYLQRESEAGGDINELVAEDIERERIKFKREREERDDEACSM